VIPVSIADGTSASWVECLFVQAEASSCAGFIKSVLSDSAGALVLVGFLLKPDGGKRHLPFILCRVSLSTSRPLMPVSIDITGLPANCRRCFGRVFGYGEIANGACATFARRRLKLSTFFNRRRVTE
jgi:hypothetical protein